MAEEPGRASFDKESERSQRSSISGTTAASSSPAPPKQDPSCYAAERERLRSMEEAKYNKMLPKIEKDIQSWKGSIIQGSTSTGQSVAGQSRSIMSSDNSAAGSAAYIEARNHLDRVLQGGEQSVVTLNSS